VKPDVASAARTLLASGCDVGSSAAIATHAASMCEAVSRHFARLIGELGMRSLFERSMYLAGATFPCLKSAAASKPEGPYETLRRCLDDEAPDVALEAAAHVLKTFIELLERFIGEELVASLLAEVWPAIFPTVVKEST
jgi:hypothetical protein